MRLFLSCVSIFVLGLVYCCLVVGESVWAFESFLEHVVYGSYYPQDDGFGCVVYSAFGFFVGVVCI